MVYVKGAGVRDRHRRRQAIAAFLIGIAFRRAVGTALTIAASLAQIGEFSFVLAKLGVGLKLLPEHHAPQSAPSKIGASSWATSP